MEFDKQLSVAVDLGSDRVAGRRSPVKSMFQNESYVIYFSRLWVRRDQCNWEIASIFQPSCDVIDLMDRKNGSLWQKRIPIVKTGGRRYLLEADPASWTNTFLVDRETRLRSEATNVPRIVKIRLAFRTLNANSSMPKRLLLLVLSVPIAYKSSAFIEMSTSDSYSLIVSTLKCNIIIYISLVSKY